MSIYDPSIPQPNDTLDVSQKDILDNFSQLDTSFFVNHTRFSDTTADNGKHKFVQLPIAQATSPGTAVGELAIYQKAITGGNALYFQQQNLKSGGADVQLTNKLSPFLLTSGVDYTISPAATTSKVYATFLPGNLFQINGYFNGISDSTVYTVTLSTFFNNTSGFYSLNATANFFTAANTPDPCRVGLAVFNNAPQTFKFNVTATAPGLDTNKNFYFSAVGIFD